MNYQIIYGENDEKSDVMDLEELSKACLKMAIENKFEMYTKENGWMEHINKGEKSPIGFYMKDWKKDVSDENRLEVCREFMYTFDNEITETLGRGDEVLLYTLQELKEEGYDTEIHEGPEEDEIAFKNVDVHISQLEKMDLTQTYIVGSVDEDEDFKLSGFFMTFGNEQIKKIIKKAA